MTAVFQEAAAALGADYHTIPCADELEWQKDGHCQGVEDWVFYTEGHGSRGETQWAKRICRDCPVLQECRNWALSHHEQYGVWGGMSAKERRAIWKKTEK